MSIYLINEFLNVTDPNEQDIVNVQYHAGNGNAEAQYHLALMYDTGKGVERNPREAEKWYKQAAQRGHAAAQYYLARLYSTHDSGIKRDEKEAARLYKAAAEQGHPEAIKMVVN